MSSLALWIEKGLAYYINKYRRANTAENRIKEKKSKEKNSEKDAIIQRDLSRLVASKDNNPFF